jgi:phage terminase small subunit
MKEEQTNGLKLGVRDILQKYIDIAFADITDFITFGTHEVVQKDEHTGELLTNEHGEPLTDYVTQIHLVDSENVDGTILTEVKEGRDGISVKLADKMKALEMLSKYFDLLSENDKKRLQEEKLKADAAKAMAEVERISKDTGDDIEEIIVVDEWSDSNE